MSRDGASIRRSLLRVRANRRSVFNRLKFCDEVRWRKRRSGSEAPSARTNRSRRLIFRSSFLAPSSLGQGRRTLSSNARRAFATICQRRRASPSWSIRARRTVAGASSCGPDDPPVIDANHLSDPRDLPTLMTAVKSMRKAMQQPAIRQLISREISPGEAVNDDRALEAEIRQNGGTVSHHCGTCAIGRADRSVVDSELRVRGVDGLRVVDTSVIPIIPNATLHSHALMIGERGADFVRPT
jgi:choline dehydrogenase-like flavoprotein